MLTEFEGIIDCSGLRTFRQCDRQLPFSNVVETVPNRVQFWAVLESESALMVLRELRAGYRASAHRLLEELAISLGTLTK